MSQSGNAALASQGQESALPSPSPSLLDLPDDPLEPPNTPRSHISTIRRIISAKKVKSTKLTLANFSEIFASLDALDQYLSNGKQLEDALSVFKVELLAELKKNAPAAPTTRSYSSAATSPSSALPTSPPHAPAPKPSPSKASKLTVNHTYTSLVPYTPPPLIAPLSLDSHLPYRSLPSEIPPRPLVYTHVHTYSATWAPRGPRALKWNNE
ncbi:hypothetical protein C8F04DRAFT_1187269 [Mycena alexandri]|uniref:Uncharacterized protein n=1 Tax=Mycena alexandri TaxID=1745969 RepID=A0AAD6WYG3_9AGAR|nr:hypothetical protein C8F04DRAFT_1187269 [Mycena alexandri]